MGWIILIKKPAVPRKLLPKRRKGKYFASLSFFRRRPYLFNRYLIIIQFPVSKSHVMNVFGTILPAYFITRLDIYKNERERLHLYQSSQNGAS